MKSLGYFWGSVIPYDIYMALIGACGAAMNSAFVFRYAAVTGRVEWFTKKKTWILVIVFHVLLPAPSLITHGIAQKMEGTPELIMEYIGKVSFKMYLKVLEIPILLIPFPNP